MLTKTYLKTSGIRHLTYTKLKMEATKLSKNQIERDLKKLKKKQLQAIATLQKGEGLPLDQLTTETPTGKMLVTHFGNGDEKD